MKPEADNAAMVMDLYELTMANGYFQDPELHTTKVAFDVFFRKIPDGGGFAIFAGLEQIVDYITNLHFEKDDVVDNTYDINEYGRINSELSKIVENTIEEDVEDALGFEPDREDDLV